MWKSRKESIFYNFDKFTIYSVFQCVKLREESKCSSPRKWKQLRKQTVVSERESDGDILIDLDKTISFQSKS